MLKSPNQITLLGADQCAGGSENEQLPHSRPQLQLMCGGVCVCVHGSRWALLLQKREAETLGFLRNDAVPSRYGNTTQPTSANQRKSAFLCTGIFLS